MKSQENKLVFLTGATGFIGSHIARALINRGFKVRTLARKNSRLDNLAGLPVEICYGDLLDTPSLKNGISGCPHVYHAAANYVLWSKDPDELYRINVEGTKNVFEACLFHGVERIVYTSSVGALGIPKNGTPGDERTPVSLDDMIGHYKRSKFLAEEEAMQYAKRGLPVVIVNPSTPVGSHDIKPTPTGKMIVDFLNGKMPAYVDTGLNLIDVEDAAIGHILACEKGRIGERYILGHRNMTLKEILHVLSKITKIPAPKFKIPYPLALTVGYISKLYAERVSKKEPAIPWEGVKMAKKHMYFNPSKAINELGLPQSPVEAALEKAVKWFKENGYVKQLNH